VAGVCSKRSPNNLFALSLSSGYHGLWIVEHVGGRLVAQPTVGRHEPEGALPRREAEWEGGEGLLDGRVRTSLTKLEGREILLAAVLDRENIAGLFPASSRGVWILRPQSRLRSDLGARQLENVRNESIAKLEIIRGQCSARVGELVRQEDIGKLYTACSRPRARRNSTVFAHELPPRSAGFDAENRLYLFALTVPGKTIASTARAAGR
jgi:hypothetical protein